MACCLSFTLRNSRRWNRNGKEGTYMKRPRIVNKTCQNHSCSACFLNLMPQQECEQAQATTATAATALRLQLLEANAAPPGTASETSVGCWWWPLAGRSSSTVPRPFEGPGRSWRQLLSQCSVHPGFYPTVQQLLWLLFHFVSLFWFYCDSNARCTNRKPWQ